MIVSLIIAAAGLLLAAAGILLRTGSSKRKTGSGPIWPCAIWSSSGWRKRTII